MTDPPHDEWPFPLNTTGPMYHDMSQALTPRHQGDSFCGPTSTANAAAVGIPVAHSGYFNWFQDFNFFNFLPTPDGNGQAFDQNFLPTPTTANKPGKGSFNYGGMPIMALNTPAGRYKKDDPSLLPEERERRDRRRQRNKEAAARCRQRRLDLIDDLGERKDTLEKANQEKERQIEVIKKELSSVLEYFKAHLGHMNSEEKEAYERAASILDQLGIQNCPTAGYEAMDGSMEQKNFNLPLTHETIQETKFLDLVSPKHAMTPGQFNGVPNFPPLPSLHDNIMSDYMFNFGINQLAGMTTSNGPNPTVESSLEEKIF